MRQTLKISTNNVVADPIYILSTLVVSNCKYGSYNIARKTKHIAATNVIVNP